MDSIKTKPEIVPFAPSVAWYATWWQARRKGWPDTKAIAAANIATGVRGKDFARCRIMANGNEVILSIAIEGGAARLKRESYIPNAQLSDHGNWRHIHLGAIEAAYGRSPYFQHLFPIIREVYSATTNSLAAFNLSLHNAISTFLDASGQNCFDISDHIHPDIIQERASELASQISANLSIIGALMHLGPELLLPLISIRN